LGNREPMVKPTSTEVGFFILKKKRKNVTNL
jgi:hypothetical protein